MYLPTYRHLGLDSPLNRFAAFYVLVELGLQCWIVSGVYLDFR